MSYRILSKVLFSCFFLASCSSTSTITPSSVPSQSKKSERQKEFSFETQDPAALVRLAKGFKQSGDLVSALNLYGKASVSNPKLLEPWIGIIRLLQEINNPVGARIAIKDAQKYHPNDPEIAIIAAEIEIADDKATEAITILAPHMDRKDYRISNLLGVASDMMGSPSVARKYYSTAFSYNPNAARLTDNLALSFSFYNDHKTAISILQKNLTNAQNRKASVETLAVIYAMDNQLDAALSLARSTLTDEEVADNFSFYQALGKLPPKMRARAVFTRNIPIDALPYLQDSMQAVAKTEKTHEFSKEDMARDLVNQRANKSSPVTPLPSPALETVAKNIETKQDSTLTKKDLQLAMSENQKQEPARLDENISQEDRPLSSSPLKALPQETVTEDKKPQIAEEKKPAPRAIVVEEKLLEQQELASKESNIKDTVPAEVKTSSSVPMPSKAAISEEIIPSLTEKVATASQTIEPEIKAEPTEVDIAPQDTAIEARNAYRVQIAAFTNIISAQTEWCRIAKRVAAAEVYEQPNLRIFGEGDETRYRLLLGEYDDRAEANATCDALKTKKLGCYVVKGAGKLRPLESDCKR